MLRKTFTSKGINYACIRAAFKMGAKDFRVMNYGGKTMGERAMSHVGSAEASTTKKEERCRHKYKHAKTSKRA